MTTRRYFTTILFLLALTIGVSAQTSLNASFTKAAAKPVTIERRDLFRPFGPMTAISTVVCLAGTFADVATSGGAELNPLLRNSSGQFSQGKALAIGAGICGGTLLIERLAPSTSKAMSVIRFIGGGVHFGVALHNRSIK